MLIPTFQMRAPSKRWIVVAGVLVTSLVSIAWSFDRFVRHGRGSGGVAAGKTAVLDSFPLKPADLMANKQWHSSTGTDVEVVGISADKAHVILPHAKRLRADGSLIESVGFLRVHQDR